MYNVNFYTNTTNPFPRESIALRLFWFGFIMYISAFTLSYTPYSTNLWHFIQVASLGIFIVGGLLLTKLKFEDEYLSFLFGCFFIWSVIVICRGFELNSKFIKDEIYDARYGVLPYFVPLILLLPFDKLFFKKLFESIVVLGIVYLILDVLFIRLLLNSDQSSALSQSIIETFAILSIPCGYILLTSSYHGKIRNIFALFVIIVSLFFAIIRARRGLISICSTILFFSFLQYLYYSRRKLLIFYLTILVVSITALGLSNIFKIGKHNLFNFVLERGDEDTRSGVELYFYDDMGKKDWIIGKGIDGKYYCPDIDKDDITGYRTVIETDYLQLILNGGLIFLTLLLLILIPAIILGIFFSKNLLSKGAAIWIFLWILYLYPARVLTFSLQYFLVWVSVGVCYSKTIRNCSDELITEKFF